MVFRWAGDINSSSFSYSIFIISRTVFSKSCRKLNYLCYKKHGRQTQNKADNCRQCWINTWAYKNDRWPAKHSEKSNYGLKREHSHRSKIRRVSAVYVVVTADIMCTVTNIHIPVTADVGINIKIKTWRVAEIVTASTIMKTEHRKQSLHKQYKRWRKRYTIQHFK